MTKKVTQVHHGSGDNVAGDKIVRCEKFRDWKAMLDERGIKMSDEDIQNTVEFCDSLTKRDKNGGM